MQLNSAAQVPSLYDQVQIREKSGLLKVFLVREVPPLLWPEGLALVCVVLFFFFFFAFSR